MTVSVTFKHSVSRDINLSIRNVTIKPCFHNTNNIIRNGFKKCFKLGNILLALRYNILRQVLLFKYLTEHFELHSKNIHFGMSSSGDSDTCRHSSIDTFIDNIVSSGCRYNAFCFINNNGSRCSRLCIQGSWEALYGLVWGAKWVIMPLLCASLLYNINRSPIYK